MEVENNGKKMDDDDLLRLLDEETKETSVDETVDESTDNKKLLEEMDLFINEEEKTAVWRSSSNTKSNSNLSPSTNSTLPKDGETTTSSVVDSEFDYSILWDDEDEDNGFLTYSLDKLPDDIDLSLLDDEDDLEDDDDEDAAVVEEAEQVEDAKPEETDEIKKQKAKDLKEKITKARKAQRRRIENALREKKIIMDDIINRSRGEPEKIKEEYYKLAMQKWPMESKSGVRRPDGSTLQIFLPHLDDPKLHMPNVWFDKANNKKIFETPDEWADKHHPMWAKYQEFSQNDQMIGAFIHSEWGWHNQIDVTRNLTKFGTSQKSVDNSNTGDDDNTKGADPKKSTNGQVIDQKDQLKKVVSTLTLAGCKFCANICHCSPGRRKKKPYFISEGDKPVKDEYVVYENKMQIEKVHYEIRDAIQTQKNHSSNFLGRDYNYYNTAASNVLGSTDEVSELLLHYRKDQSEEPNFTKEQVRELISVEICQDKFRQFYKSPYEGNGHSDVENDSDDEDDEEEEGKNKWEDY